MRKSEIFSAFTKYFRVVRKLVHKFHVEPAGSRGMWGLDDYQLLPFLFGSAELVGSDLRLDDLFDRDCCYAEAVRFSEKTKGRGVVPFSKHSPRIYAMRDKSWEEINEIVMSEYDSFVLSSQVVTQHFVYSESLPRVAKR